MAATALIQFLQAPLTGLPGQVLVGIAGVVPITIQNTNNVGVASWQIDLVYTPPGSAVPVATPLAFNDNSNTPLDSSVLPDVPGCYRYVLKVWDVINRVGLPTDIDIRNFVILSADGTVLPPYQNDPQPLPTLASGLVGAKPNEMNINGSELGWIGNGGDGLLGQVLQKRINPSLQTAQSQESLVADSLVPFLNFPLAVVFDGTSLWVLKTNAGFVLGGVDTVGWGVARIDPVRLVYTENLSLGDGGAAVAQPVPGFDIFDKLLWTGTQLFAFGFNPISSEAIAQEIIRGSGTTPSSLGVRCVLNIPFEIVVGAVWDSINSKVFIATVATGSIYRFDPATLSTPFASFEVFLALNVTAYDLAYDVDTAAYPDAKPKLYVPSAGTVYRITDLDLLAFTVDASVSDPATRLILAAGFLFGGASGSLTRFIKEPLAVDINTGGPNFPLGIAYDPISNNGFITYIDNVTANPNVQKIDTALNFIGSPVIIDSNAFSAIPFAPSQLVVLPPAISQTLIIPEDGLSHVGYGNVWALDIPTFTTPVKVTNPFRLHYSAVNQRIQYCTNPADLANTTWDGVSDAIVLAFPFPGPCTITIGSAPKGKRLVVIDALGGVSATNTVTFTFAIPPQNPPAILTTPFGFVEFMGVGVGFWAEKGRSVVASVPPFSTTFFVDIGTTVVAGNNGSVGAPWQTITAAVAPLTGSLPTSIVMSPGDYTGESPITIPGAFTGDCSFSSFSPPNFSVGAGVGQSGLSIPNVSSPQNLLFEGVNAGTLSAGVLLTARHSTISDASGGDLDLSDCKLITVTNTGAGFASTLIRSSSLNSFAGSITTAGTLVVLRECGFVGGPVSITFTGAPGTVNVDAESYRSAVDAGGFTITNGTLDIVASPVLESLDSPGSDQNDYAPPGWRDASVALVSPSAQINVTGFAAVTTGVLRKTLVNNGSGSQSVITLKHQNVGSLGPNRLNCYNGADVSLGYRQSASLTYDNSLLNWIVEQPIAALSETTDNPSTNQNDYSPIGWTSTGIHTLDLGASINITGFDAKVGVLQKTLININSSFSVTLKHQNASSAVGNRLDLYNGADIVLGFRQSVTLNYDIAGIVWRADQEIAAPTETSDSLSSQQNNYSPPGWSSTGIHEISPTGAVSITGFDAQVGVLQKTIVNDSTNSGASIVLKHQNVSSLAANRIECPGGSDLTLGLRGVALLVYDLTNSYWRAVGFSAATSISEITDSPAADQNNYAPTGWSDAGIALISPSAAINITGFSNSVNIIRKTLTNTSSGSTNTITLKHQNASSSAGNRLDLYNGADIILGYRQTVNLIYDSGNSVWRADSYIPSPSETSSSTGTSQNDYAPTGWTSTGAHLVNASAAINITGFSSTVGVLVKHLINSTTTSANTITLKHQSTSSSVGNRIECFGGVDIVMSQRQIVTLIYDLGNSYWRAQ